MALFVARILLGADLYLFAYKLGKYPHWFGKMSAEIYEQALYHGGKYAVLGRALVHPLSNPDEALSAALTLRQYPNGVTI